MSVELVAEVGSNWNGSLETAELLINAVAECGADTVKFQHYPDNRYGPHPIPISWLSHLNHVAKSWNLNFLCSVFDIASLHEYVIECEPTRVKIASPELTYNELLLACVDAGLEVILSTGMSTESEIREATAVLYTADHDVKVTLLHCTSSYPPPLAEMNLNGMLWLSQFANAGLSDHSLDPIMAPVIATSLGASMIEKHLTLDRQQDGPDHAYALDPKDFSVMVAAVRTAEMMLGDGVKQVMPSEDPSDRRNEAWR